MKFTITREQLQEGLMAVAAAIPAKTTLPVLANVLVEAAKPGLRLSGTDLDIAVSTTVPAEVDTEGAVTLPAKKLVDIVRELPGGPVRVTAAGEARVSLECGRAKFKLLGLPREEFPSFPAVKFDGAWKAAAGVVHKLVGHVTFAASTEESRPILNGVLWELRADRMRMVATNGHRLAKMDVPAKGGSAADLIVPPKALGQGQVLGANARPGGGPGRAPRHLRGRAAGDRVQRRVPARDPQVHADRRGPVHLQGPRARGHRGAGGVERSGELHGVGDAIEVGRLETRRLAFSCGVTQGVRWHRDLDLERLGRRHHDLRHHQRIDFLLFRRDVYVHPVIARQDEIAALQQPVDAERGIGRPGMR